MKMGEWSAGPPRDLHRRAWWRCSLREEGAIEPRPVKPGLGQGVMEKWGLVFLVSVQDFFYRSLSPSLRHSNTPLIPVNQNLVAVTAESIK